jgi:hypothetical protein
MGKNPMDLLTIQSEALAPIATSSQHSKARGTEAGEGMATLERYGSLRDVVAMSPSEIGAKARERIEAGELGNTRSSMGFPSLGFH